MLVIHISNESFNSVPAFPLAGVHLFPHMVLPLNIFEPRYIDMVDYALEHDHLLSIATPVDPTELEDELIDAEAPPPTLRPILGAGVIVAKEEVAPKRYQIFVRGVTRIRMREELDQMYTFRQVEAEIIQDEEVDADTLARRETDLRNMLVSYATAYEKHAEEVKMILKHSPNAEVLTNLLGARVRCPAQDKRALFEELNPLQRIIKLERHFSRLLLKRDTYDAEVH